MSEETKKTEEAKPADAAPPASKKPSAVGGVLKLVIPALLAAGASYGGTRYAKAQNAIVIVKEKEEAESGGKGKHELHPPGPTVSLEPFLLSVFDASKKPHPMKMTVAVEFDAKAAAHDDPKAFMPRIRDAVLTHLRKTTYEDISDPAHYDRLRKELLEQCHEVGAESAKKILITDFVIQ
ncbi:MAG: flagellar basal body-associated FliL family protein [Labilithrix sp.]|nr:flagellar basal body-associated FliL family protein [Labilithrix sp.]MCW5817155.1 flagellar basal body-associated FliL family protein [Labilithrix sp.]